MCPSFLEPACHLLNVHTDTRCRQQTEGLMLCVSGSLRYLTLTCPWLCGGSALLTGNRLLVPRLLLCSKQGAWCQLRFGQVQEVTSDKWTKVNILFWDEIGYLRYSVSMWKATTVKWNQDLCYWLLPVSVFRNALLSNVTNFSYLKIWYLFFVLITKH